MSDFDAEKDSNYIMYFDVNNLYGYAMQKPLPYGGFKWLEDVENFNVQMIDDNSNKGYILEVDLAYPENLHHLHSDLPFCPEHKKPPGSKCKKLLTTLHNKEKYVIHYTYLKHALQNGLQLKKIHRILEFDQKPFLKSYIDLNSSFRQKANNEFDKNFYKLMNNSVFGKTIENVRKRVDVKLLTRWGKMYGA